MNLRKAAQQALEALEEYQQKGAPFMSCDAAVDALRAALSDEAMQRLTDVQQEMEPTCQAPQHVEPVAYVTGYSKGRCIIEAVDPDWLLPVGMALYRSPPTINEMETVEPVAYMMVNHANSLVPSLHFKAPTDWHITWEAIPLYTTPPKRKPLTDEEIDYWIGSNSTKKALCRAIERAHDIGGGE